MRFLAFSIVVMLAAAGRAQDTCDVVLSGTPLTCPGDADGSLTVLGDAGPFTFSWSHDPFLDTATVTGLSIGPYSVVVMDTLGCMAILDTVIEDPIVEPLGTMTTTNISCAGNDDGTVTFTVDPGPYTWEWVDDPNETSVTLTDLGPGGYTVLVSGGECPSYVTGWLGDPAIVITGALDYCPSHPPVLSTVLEWGFQPDIYLWSTGDTTATLHVLPGTVGLVEVTGIDTSIGCVASDDVFLTELPSPTVLFHAPDSLCIRVGGQAVTTASNADSLVWRWGTSGFSNLSDPSVLFDAPLWQPISLQGFDSLGCGGLPVQDSVFVRPRIPAYFTAEQIPCTPLVDLRLGSTADSCAFYIGDDLVFFDCSGVIRWDFEKYRPYPLTFYSTQPNRCDDTLAVIMNVRTEPTLFLPSAFTPNGDGINDTWPGPVDIPEDDYLVQLFDRWGRNLWTTTDTQERWDGAAVPDGVYVFTMRMRDPCEPTNEISRKGYVTLIR